MNLRINEIFYSIQGESSFAGRPCIFIRLTGCPLRCSYCDTGYAFHQGQDMSIDAILEKVQSYTCNLVEVTGGEPLAQENSIKLMQALIDHGYEVMLETSGALSVKQVPQQVKIIMDIKTPSSNEMDKNIYDNFNHLKQNIDEIKYVIKNKEDFDFCTKVSDEFELWDKFTVLASPNFKHLDNLKLAQWVLASKKPYRMQLQMHKYIWDPEEKGV
ncbi:MAG TPA: radical SAM protein [Oligoflexia bacterium]|nr:radical SAM protein [Oligoflexia bacterium]HMR23968.1 radical SAM protein [Oligoflexia bacterium]